MAATEMKVLLSAKEKVLLGLTCLLIPIFLLEIFGITLMRSGYPEFQTNPDMPQLKDLLIGIGISFIFIFLRFLSVRLFKPLGRRVLSSSNRIQESRVERFATVLFKFWYFVGITITGYMVMKDESWFPPVYGGTGDPASSFYILHIPPKDKIKMYYFIQLGYHLHSLLYMVFFSPIRNDFIEMLLHHVATLILIGGSYLSNYCAMGALVAYTHDIGDIAGYAIKSAVDTGYVPLIAVLYINLLVVWVFTRLYVFPVHLIYTAIFKLPIDNMELLAIFVYPGNLLQVMLLFLHIYWFVLFLVMGYRLATKNVVEDIQQQIPDTKETNVKKNN